MWKGRGGETCSGPVVGDVVGSVVAQKYLPEEVRLTAPQSQNQQPPPSFTRSSVTKTSKGSSSESQSQWQTNSFQQNSLRARNIGPPRRCDSSELADSPVRAEAIKVNRFSIFQSSRLVYNMNIV
jgi:hypothetical protein